MPLVLHRIKYLKRLLKKERHQRQQLRDRFCRLYIKHLLLRQAVERAQAALDIEGYNSAYSQPTL
eukprot:12171141-Prorocentrum_lima.AAC.1